MARQGLTVQMVGLLTMAVLMASCSNVTTQTPPTLGFHSASPLLPIPTTVQRIVVLYPRGEAPEWSSAYSRLEGAAFQLRAFRPNLRIIDRSHIPALTEHARQPAISPFDKGKCRSEHERIQQQQSRAMIEHIVTHFVTEHGKHFILRRLVQKIVVQ